MEDLKSKSEFLKSLRDRAMVADSGIDPLEDALERAKRLHDDINSTMVLLSEVNLQRETRLITTNRK